jgi:hypothetical protein
MRSAARPPVPGKNPAGWNRSLVGISAAHRGILRIAAVLLASVSILPAANIFSHISHPTFRHPVEWTELFDGISLDGWKADQNPGSWSVKDGAIRGEGADSRLIYQSEKCVDCELKMDVRISKGGAAGIYVRGSAADGSFRGYEAIINNTGADPSRTGSLAGSVKVPDQMVADDTWFNADVLVQGNHVQISVNGKVTADFTDQKDSYFEGSVALEQHPGAVVEFKNVEFRIVPKELGDLPSPLRGLWRLKSDPAKLEQRIEEERDGLRFVSNTETFWARTDGQDYLLAGSTAYDHISLLEVTHHRNLHQGMKMAKIRKKPDGHVYMVETKLGWTKVGSATWTVSPDGRTLTEDGPAGKIDLQRVE